MTDLKAAAIRGVRTALFAFFGTFVPAVVGWLSKVAEWASSNGSTEFPTASGLVYVAISAASAAVSGLIGFLWNWAENKYHFALLGAKQDDKS